MLALHSCNGIAINPSVEIKYSYTRVVFTCLFVEQIALGSSEEINS